MRVRATLSDYSELACLIHHILLERQFLFCARWPSVGSLEEARIYPLLIYQKSLFTRERAGRFLDTVRRLAGLRSRSAGMSNHVSEMFTNTENRSVSLHDTAPPSLEDWGSDCVCAQALHDRFFISNRSCWSKSEGIIYSNIMNFTIWKHCLSFLEHEACKFDISLQIFAYVVNIYNTR